MGGAQKSAPRALISRILPLPIERSSFVSVQRSAMAEAPDTSDKRLEELEEEITCAVCQAICLSRVSQGGHSTPRRRGGAAGRVLRGKNDRSVQQNGEGGGALEG